MRSLYIESAHASLEYDQAFMFALVSGYAVAGNFDVGSKQRPKIEHVTDHNLSIQEGLEHADIYLMHQVPEFDVQFNAYCQRRKKPIVLHYFGQGCDRMHSNVARILDRYANAYVSAYSKTDYERLLSFGAPKEKVKMIRFGKMLINDWNGNLPVGYISGNSIHKRGVGCGFHLVQELLAAKTPIVISGNDTQELPFGLGEISMEAMQNMYRTARCYVSMGTIPAPYVLTSTEAICMGQPVVAYDNGSGVEHEDLGFCVQSSVIGMYQAIMQMIDDRSYAERWHKEAVKASQDFDMHRVAKQWDDFMNEMRTA